MRTTSVTVHDVEALSVAVLVDNQVLGLGIEVMLQALPSIATVYGCAGRERAEELVAAGAVDALIAAGTHTGWLTSLRRAWPTARTRLLLLVDDAAMEEPAGCASAAVDGFLAQRDLSAATIEDALRRARSGDVPMPPALARALLARADAAAPSARRVNLTSREIETLGLLVRGLSNKQIARYLSISSHGAKRLVGSIMVKLDSPNRTTAVVSAIKAGIVPCG